MIGFLERILIHIGNNLSRRRCGNASSQPLHMIAGTAHREDVFTINIRNRELIVSYATKWGP